GITIDDCWEGWVISLRQKQKKLIMLPSETMIWQPEFTDKTLSRKTGAVHQPPDDTSHHVLRWHATALPVFTRINRYQNAE
ncbi:TPA: hypothetical protein ACWAET_003393, partial [Escherichia coli]|uniref:hypothetical protein n=1 Tax=Escherichia coli TaxID=562 RepID=UPI001BC86998